MAGGPEEMTVRAAIIQLDDQLETLRWDLREIQNRIAQKLEARNVLAKMVGLEPAEED